MDRLEFRLELQIHQHFLTKAVATALEQDLKRGGRRYHGIPRVEIEPPWLSTQLRHEADQLKILTDDQYRVIESLEDKDLLSAKVRGVFRVAAQIHNAEGIRVGTLHSSDVHDLRGNAQRWAIQAKWRGWRRR